MGSRSDASFLQIAEVGHASLVVIPAAAGSEYRQSEQRELRYEFHGVFLVFGVCSGRNPSGRADNEITEDRRKTLVRQNALAGSGIVIN
jgi:hypothetical protein